MNFLFVVVLAAIVPLSVLGSRGRVVILDSIVWTLYGPKEIKIDAKSPISIDLVAEIAPESDSVKGKNLWRVGIYGSEHKNGSGERFGFKSQILKAKQASKRPTGGQPLRMRNILSRFDLSQIGCNEVRYFCLEFAKNSDATVDFELRAGTDVDSVVSCEELECRRPEANVETTGGEILPEVLVDQPRALLYAFGSSVEVMGICRDRSHNISIDVTLFAHPSSDIIWGIDLWKLGVFLSNATNEPMTRSQYKPDIMTAEQKVTPLIPSRLSTLNLFTALHTTGLGCPESDLQYICLEFDKGDNPFPYFDFPHGPILRCLRFNCIRPKV